MKLTRFSILGLALCGVAAADVPKKVPETRYASLWMNSPFTSKPPPPESAPESNPLEDYALLGVSPIGEGRFRVTVISKKSPEERIYVESDKENKQNLKILNINKKPGDPLGTTVKMSSGSKTGTLEFDEKLLTLAPPAAATRQPNQPGQPGMAVQPGQPVVNPGQPGQPVQAGQQQTQVQPGQAPARQPRARVVPPPTAQPATSGQGNQHNNGGRDRDRRRPN